MNHFSMQSGRRVVLVVLAFSLHLSISVMAQVARRGSSERVVWVTSKSTLWKEPSALAQKHYNMGVRPANELVSLRVGTSLYSTRS